MTTSPNKKTLAKAIVLFGGAQIITILAALIRSKVAAVTVGAMGVGLTALYQSITGLITNICNLGLSDSGVQVLSKNVSTNNTSLIQHTIGMLRLWGVITGLAAMLLTIIASPLLCKLYFGDYMSHWHSVMVLSIVPLCTIITGIEMVVLKSLQQTRKLTISIIASSIISIIISVPLYIMMGWNGIVFILLFTAILSTGVTITLSYSTNSTLPDISLLRGGFSNLWKESRGIIMLGITLVITGIGSMGADLLLQTYITAVSTLTFVGFYKAGYQMAITYPSMVFTAVNNDYYPRLSTLVNNTPERNILATRQTITLLVIVTPCILLFIALLPWIIPFLLSDEFSIIVPMVRIGAASVILRCISIPLCYMPLALGRKWDFVIMELVSYAGLIVCVICGCKLGNLSGIGYGILASNFIDLIYGYILCNRKYGFRYTHARKAA